MAMRLAGAGGGAYALQHNSQINVTPFVDVMLVLLIIFMVAIPVATTSHKLDLPPAQPSAVTTPPVVVTVRKDGLYLGSAPTSLDALPADLARALGGPDPASRRIYLRAEHGVRYGAFMSVMNRLEAGGFHQIALVNEDL